MAFPLIIGVTGGIGCGKSSVARLFEALDVETLDADHLAHAVSRPEGRAYSSIVALFGPSAVQPDGTLDRSFIRRRVFADAVLRSRLEAIIHPLVAEETERRVAQWHGPYGLCIVPLLFERPGLRDRADRVLVVDCPLEMQIARLQTTRLLPESDARAIIAAQVSRAERLTLADDIIDNSGPPDDLPPQVARLDRLYRALAQEPSARKLTRNQQST